MRSRSRGAEAPREKLASGWGYYLGDAAIGGRLSSGRRRDKRSRSVHPEDWLGAQRESQEPAEALREVARRYSRRYGPVTHREFREWFTSASFKPADARGGLRGARSRQVELEGRKGSYSRTIGRRGLRCACCRSTTST